MGIWCGSLNLSDGVGDQGADICDDQLDDSAVYSFGYCSCYPQWPIHAASWYSPVLYTQPVALGVNGSYWSGNSNVTMSVLKSENVDFVNPSLTYNPFCNMRFRHMGNTTCNFLFLDGHVESRTRSGSGNGCIHESFEPVCQDAIDRFPFGGDPSWACAKN